MLQEDIHKVCIKINDVKELFNTLDPAPFMECDLDDRAMEYITDSVMPLPLKKKVMLEVHIPKEQAAKISVEQVSQAIRNNYEFMISSVNSKLKHLLRDGRKALLIGITFLVLCLNLSHLAQISFQGFWASVLKEGLIIIGWVSMWKPINIFLYEWWPLVREIKLYQKVKGLKVRIKEI